MLTDIGEFIVGAYLQIVEECDVVDYNVRPPGGGLEGLGELDVIGLNFKTNTAYFCEVTTHIRGLLYKNNQESISRVRKNMAGKKNMLPAIKIISRTISLCFGRPMSLEGI